MVLAVWFRKRQGVAYVCAGKLHLWSHCLPELPEDPNDPDQVLALNMDSRYGGDPVARWDGVSYWGDTRPLNQARYLAKLEPLLANYHENNGKPDVPDGHSGWWSF